MLEFPSTRNGWNLDIVSILAVLGEANIKVHRLNMTASKWSLLPRLLPAPQALLAEERAVRLPAKEAKVFGMPSGIQRPSLNFMADVLLQTEYLSPFAVQEVTINEDYTKGSSTLRSQNPLTAMSVFSCALSVGLLAWAIVLRDGVAVVAIVLASLTSSILCYASLWNMKVPEAPRGDSPREKIVAALSSGGFVVVDCTLAAARSLFWADERCLYRLERKDSQAFSGVLGGLMLLVAIVLLGNCSWVMQAAIIAVYGLLNLLYWAIILVPDRIYWDMDCWRIEATTHEHDTFTEALWTTIRVSKKTYWAKEGNIVPNTEPWEEWLWEAQHRVDLRDVDALEWNAVEALHRIIRAHHFRNDTLDRRD